MHIPPAPIADPPAGDHRHWGWSWTFAFVANLPLPGAFGWQFTAHNGGVVGMVLAVAVLYAVGLGLCATGPALREVIVSGAVCTTALQLILLPHVVAGAVALFAFNQVWRPTDWFGAEVRGFAVTMLTAVPIGLLAFLAGGGPRLLRAAPPTEQVADYG